MTVRPVVAVVLLLTFPASTLAQTRLDLKSIKVVSDEPEPRPFALPVPKARAHDFQQAGSVKPCAESEARGRTDADKRGLNKGWFWGGVGAGAAVGIFGLVTSVVAATIKPKPKTMPSDVDVACYTQGYASKARHENALSALWGGFVGTAVFWLLVAAGLWG